MKRVTILGSTGSIGCQTLEVIAGFPERFRVVALAAGRQVEKLAEQVEQFRPERVSVADEAGAEELRGRVGDAVAIEVGAAGLLEVASHPADLVVAGLVGAVGLAPTLAAIRAGRSVALANKEVMVMAGALIRREVEKAGVALIPVDSEHSAIFQALSGVKACEIARLILTASGGPFRTWSAERMVGASIEEALDHPNWDMGPKISVDSATLMNKGLEVIEARWLFDVDPDRIEVLVHPQSIVHSMVETIDRSVLAQLGLPDMRVPIAVALAYPARLPLDLPSLDLAELSRLDFSAPDHERFPCLGLAYEALAGSEEAPAVLNAANEISVALFLEGAIPFAAIAEANARVLREHAEWRPHAVVTTLEEVEAADAWARARTREILDSHTVQSASGAV